MTFLGRSPYPLLGATLLAAMGSSDATAGPQRAVVELFTSQGCSSCPPADAVAGRLREDPAVLVLSFHVDYWDGPGWKDSFSSAPGTARQYAYAKWLHESSVFTPQVIVNGSQSLVGSQEGAVRQAVTAANQADLPVDARPSEQPDGHFALNLSGAPMAAQVLEVRYVRLASTAVRGGENAGRTVQTFNNVTEIRQLGPYKAGTLEIGPLKKPDDGIAILVQASGTGRIVGAAAVGDSR